MALRGRDCGVERVSHSPLYAAQLGPPGSSKSGFCNLDLFRYRHACRCDPHWLRNGAVVAPSARAPAVAVVAGPAGLSGDCDSHLRRLHNLRHRGPAFQRFVAQRDLWLYPRGVCGGRAVSRYPRAAFIAIGARAFMAATGVTRYDFLRRLSVPYARRVVVVVVGGPRWMARDHCDAAARQVRGRGLTGAHFHLDYRVAALSVRRAMVHVVA